MPEKKSGDWLADTAHHIYFWHGYVVIWKGMMAKSKKDGNLSSVGGPGTCSNTLKSTHKCSQKMPPAPCSVTTTQNLYNKVPGEQK